MTRTGILAAAIAALLAAPSYGETFLNPVFQDHAVLQRDQPIAVWGSAAPGAALTVSLAASVVESHADASGHWKAQLPALPAGGPYVLKVQSASGGEQSLSDILIGDVYLCSGQSNMAYTVMGAIDAGPDIQVSDNDRIRLMSVDNKTSLTPLTSLPAPGPWAPASPKTVANFSAACYFFARDLQKSVPVPLGLIQAPWAGANITAFMSAEALHKAGGDDVRLDALKRYTADPVFGLKHWGSLIEAWWRQKGMAYWSDPAVSASWPLAPKDLGIWSEWKLPPLEHFAGHVWFRTEVTLTAKQAAQSISLGTITEEDQTWINGQFLAATFGYGQARKYDVPSNLLHAGVNDILINVYCGWRGCGMFGPPEARAVHLADGSAVPLNGPWRYQQVPASVGTAPRLPWGVTAGLTMAYNAMIAPLAPYGLRGVLWYQGESNTGNASTYQRLTKAWMEDWRHLFQAPALPFVIAQLPQYGLPPFTPEDSEWAALREAQRLAVADDAHAALAVTIDIGDHMGLHPANKQEVGRRFALAARRMIYNDKSLQSGPMPISASRKGGVVTVDFSGVNGKLAAVNAVDPIGFELCAEALESCRFVSATIHGSAVALTVPRDFAPTRVRYCWGDGPVCTLYDTSRIPAVPFALPVGRTAAK